MPTQYSHSADTLCLSIRALRLSRGKAPALLGSILSPGAARWSHMGWSCVCRRKLGLGSREVWPPSPASCTALPRSPQCFRHTWRSRGCPLTGWLRILCGFYPAKLELEHLAHLLKLSSLWWHCAAPWKGRGLSLCHCSVTAYPQTWVEVDWLYVWTHTEALP